MEAIMRTKKLIGIMFLFILSSFLFSCQKETDAKLKSCSNACKAQFESIIGACDANKDEGEINSCKIKTMNDYNDCVQVCNNDFMKTMQKN
jgi:hypothetical protein